MKLTLNQINMWKYCPYFLSSAENDRRRAAIQEENSPLYRFFPLPSPPSSLLKKRPFPLITVEEQNRLCLETLVCCCIGSPIHKLMNFH